nr:uncharacterized protein LOC121126205 isoform X2 [Lepeophtheirus salmonis]
MDPAMEGWYCGQECRQVRMPSRMPDPVDDTPEDEDDSSSQASSSHHDPSLTSCRSPGCRRHNKSHNGPPVSVSKGDSLRGGSLRSSNMAQEWQQQQGSSHTPRPPRKSYSSIDIEGHNSRFGSAPNLERYHDWCADCIESSQKQRKKPTISNGTIHCPSPSARRAMEHLPKSSNNEPFYPSKSPFRKFKTEKRNQRRRYIVYSVWIVMVCVALILYFILLGEILRQRNMVHELSQIIASFNLTSSN